MVAGLLTLGGFEVGSITVTDVAVKLSLVTDRPDLFEGAWQSSQLRITALAPGEGVLKVRADLRQIVPAGEPCPIGISPDDRPASIPKTWR